MLVADGMQAAPGSLGNQLTEISALQGGIEPFLKNLAVMLQHAGKDPAAIRLVASHC